MPGTIEGREEELAAFLNQHREHSLVITATSQNTMTLMKHIEQLEGGCPDLFWKFVFEFHSAEQFVDKSVRIFCSLLDVINELYPESPLLPQPPEELFESSSDPIERMRTLMTFARDLPSNLDAIHANFVFFPVEIHDFSAWKRFVLNLAESNNTRTWCSGMRMIFRDESQLPTQYSESIQQHC